MKRFACPALLVAVLLSHGCTGNGPSSTTFTSVGTTIGGAGGKAPAKPLAPPAAADLIAQANQPGGGVEKEQAKPGAKGGDETPRKIKYTADIKIICEEFPQAEESLKAALKKNKAIVAHSEVTGSPGVPRSGLWRVRVPVAHFEDFRDAVLKLGQVDKNTSDSEDVTDEYYDLENHIKNKLAEEESLRKLLDKSGDSLQNILMLREKLAQVRDYINRQEGKLRVLANLTDLTTVTVAIREKQKYDPTPPPAVSETPTFAMRAERTFTGTWDTFVGFIQLAMLALIAAAPWLGFAVVVLAPVFLIVRRWRRSLPVIGEIVPPTPPPSS